MLRPGLRMGFAVREIWEIAMFLSVLLERLQTAFRRRRALRELSVLKDRELWDIGIVRSDFRSSIRSAFD